VPTCYRCPAANSDERIIGNSLFGIALLKADHQIVSVADEYHLSARHFRRHASTQRSNTFAKSGEITDAELLLQATVGTRSIPQK
jgi:hypothetical protein